MLARTRSLSREFVSLTRILFCFLYFFLGYHAMLVAKVFFSFWMPRRHYSYSTRKKEIIKVTRLYCIWNFFQNNAANPDDFSVFKKSKHRNSAQATNSSYECKLWTDNKNVRSKLSRQERRSKALNSWLHASQPNRNRRAFSGLPSSPFSHMFRFHKAAVLCKLDTQTVLSLISKCQATGSLAAKGTFRRKYPFFQVTQDRKQTLSSTKYGTSLLGVF